ncbi:MAG: 30S ribosomal protein S8 [Desulfarculaceae bacterium]|nr:30S ribosomal protein S8 [Desulfarculaceae bacterium]MCF8048096.1 30S ribosomal protein S8 [Desulfarculaceae bacterium]MCF8064108.1 30S ribosomal protein S8 [Desulfarculaceae bacterium]MCF8099982.1 30S ribosomal protein S8 [Desulfarculaceae bacterium]MCF8122564.1 30S ribosomal protein S8 [Desulfarculaceae bacterium]
MSMQDPVADLLTRVRNAMMAHQDEVTIPSSKLKAAVARVLKEEGYVTDLSVQADDKQGLLTIKLRYLAGVPVIEGIKRISKPSCRVYVGYDQIPKVRSGLGINILSTPKGVMSDKAARMAKVGGEIICAVW